MSPDAGSLPGRSAILVQELSLDDFHRLAAIARAEAGLVIADSKRQMVQSRLARYLREIGCADFATFLDSLEGQNARGNRERLISVLTTNVSSFFRERHHFDTLAAEVLPDLIARARAGGRVRIWSAGCSSGQEPYSIAMLLLAMMPDAPKHDIRILATDIDTRILARARRGVYSAAELATLPAEHASAIRPDDSQPGGGRVGDHIRAWVTFRQLNLIEPWPMTGAFDVIFCRNVVIYFDQATQDALWPRFCAVLPEGGYLFLGHSERVHPSEKLQLSGCGVTTYKKTGPATQRRTSAWH